MPNYLVEFEFTQKRILKVKKSKDVTEEAEAEGVFWEKVRLFGLDESQFSIISINEDKK